jgi:thymidylate kinase
MGHFDMYFALEGIKGSGKTSVFEKTVADLLSAGLAFQTIRPVAARPGSLVDALQERFGHHFPDWLNERVYAHRSNLAGASAQRRGCLLGERSVLTSYVTRWNEDDPLAGLARVDRLEDRIPLPHHVMFLSVSVELALRRIHRRAKRGYGRSEQTPAQLRRADSLYRHLAALGHRYGLGHVQWHWIDADRPLHIIVDNVVDLVTRLEPTFHSPALTAAAQ